MNQANDAIEAALCKAVELNVLVSIAVCDEGGHLLAFSRMDGAGWAGVYGAQGKAIASVATGAPSGRIPPDILVMRRINELSGDRMIYAQGALPIRVGGRVVGAIGAGGATAEQDEVCAIAGVEAITKTHD